MGSPRSARASTILHLAVVIVDGESALGEGAELGIE
jgi:hypothetical protein